MYARLVSVVNSRVFTVICLFYSVNAPGKTVPPLTSHDASYSLQVRQAQARHLADSLRKNKLGSKELERLRMQEALRELGNHRPGHRDAYCTYECMKASVVASCPVQLKYPLMTAIDLQAGYIVPM
jgi:hypothetical protein